MGKVAPLVHVTGYARGMTQATGCATHFEPTEEMRERHHAWVVEHVAGVWQMWLDSGQVQADPQGAREAIALVEGEASVRSRAEWMHPLDAIGVKVMDPDGIPQGRERVDRFDALRTEVGIGRLRWSHWTAKALGVGLSTVKKYDPDVSTYDLRGPSCLYRYFDAEGRLLYVGIAKDPDKRRREHANRSPWYPLAATRTLEWFDDRDAALRGERHAIRDESPLYNVVGARR